MQENPRENRRIIFVGDIHGCLQEFDEVIRTTEYVRGKDDLIVLGDMLDRGPDPVGVVRRVREIGARSICGNHEDRALRWLRAEAARASSGRPNNMIPPYQRRREEWESLSEDDLEWLRRLPLSITVGRWVVVHAGLGPRPVYDQDADDLLHIRYVNAGKKSVPVDHSTMEQPPDTVFWTEAWPGPECVVYGHSTFSEPRVDRRPLGSVCVGLDTGCVYGGALSAAVVEGSTLELVSVKAAREYFSYSDRVGPPAETPP